MNGRAAGVGFAIIGGAYLLISNFSESTLFNKDGHVTTHSARAALGAFLLVVALVGGLWVRKGRKNPPATARWY